MNHIDEGTIHAWIDGALSAEQRREIEAHVARCAQCSAAVAEARGFVAASSRILNALDDVPANVTPKAAPKPPKKPVRQWRAARWVTGIAAVLLAAVVLRTSRETEQRAPIDSTTPAIVTAQPPTSVQAPVTAPTSQLQPQRSEIRAATSSASPVLVQVTPAREQARHDAAAARQADDDRAGERARSLADAAKTAKADAAERQLAKKSADEVVVSSVGSGAGAAAASPSAAAPMAPQPNRLLRPPQPLSLAANEEPSDVAGCYSIDQGRNLIGRVASTVASTREAQRRVAQGAAVNTSPVPRPESAPLPVIVHLDTARTRTGFMARIEGDSTLAWWSFAGDSLRVTVPGRGTTMVARSARRACPDLR